MIEPKKRKQFLFQERRDILAHMDVSKEMLVAVGARLGIVPSTLNTIVKTRKDTKKCYEKCGRLCGPKQPRIKEVASLLLLG
jgi:hypothetical protein